MILAMKSIGATTLYVLEITFLIISCASWICANDSAASTSAGGIRLVREAHVSMETERLTISEKKVTVEYEFLNTTDADITTEVAFPVPPFELALMDAGGPRGFEDFRLWIDGKQVQYETDARATLNGVDYTSLLHNLGVDVSSFGHLDDHDLDKPVALDIQKLSRLAQARLKWIGLIDRDDKLPCWSVAKTYYWKQTFPAHKQVHVRHEYGPVIGFALFNARDMDPAYRKQRTAAVKKDENGIWDYDVSLAKQIDSACIDPGLQKTLTSATQKHGYVSMAWIDYILTTANSWKTPIKDFEMVLEKFKSKDGDSSYLSLCWDGPIERVDPEHFKIKVSNFVPSKDLHVAYFVWH